MAVGGGRPFMGYDSAFSVGQETTYGTYVTGTAFIEFNSESFKAEREEVLLESINSTRDYTKRVIGKETISGSIECDLNVASDAICYIIKQAMGGTAGISTVTASCLKHTFNTGDMESNKGTSTASDVKSLSIGVRRGWDASGTSSNVFQYAGCRVNQLTIKGELGSPVVLSAEFIGQTASLTNSIGTVSYNDVLPLIFSGVKIQTGATISAASTEEYFTAFEFSLNNNLDGDQGRLGSRNITVLPPLKRDVTLKLTQRYDTATNYQRYISNTKTAISILCDCPTTIGSASGNTTYSMLINLASCYFNSNTPEVGGNDTLTHEAEVRAIRDTSTSYSVSIDVWNGSANYF
jgi:hypothetical protein